MRRAIRMSSALKKVFVLMMAAISFCVWRRKRSLNEVKELASNKENCFSTYERRMLL